MTAKNACQLERQLKGRLTHGAYLTTTDRKMVMEVRDVDTDLVWMSTEPVTREYFDNLQLDQGLAKVGAASASMDCAGFQYSPGREGEPVLQRVIDGRTYINVAKPMKPILPEQPGGPAEVSVMKAHVIGFRAGRSVTVMALPEGHFIEVVGDDSQDDSLVLPPGAELMRMELSEPWVVSLPNPTRAFFWFEQGIRSFQGPVELPGG